jgi:hypothetical protein
MSIPATQKERVLRFANRRVLLVAALAAVVLLSAGQAPPTTLQPLAEARRLPEGTALRIDGAPDESVWRLDTPIEKAVIGPSSNNRARFGVLWDADRLYVAIRVTDGALRNDSALPWKDDAAAVYLDGNHDGGGPYDAYDWEFIKGYDDAALFAKQRARSTGGDAATRTRHAWAPAEDGYTVELAIPWTELGRRRPAAGDTVGLDVGVNEDDDGGERDGQLMWAGTKFTFRNNAVFGDLVLAGPAASQGPAALQGPEAAPDSSDLLALVTRYADALLERGRDRYGPASSPLFATTLNRQTGELFKGEKRKEIENLPRSSWGIRRPDRMVEGSNPMHHQNFYQVLYALSKVTGNERYARAADRSLTWFFENTQSEATGFFPWGEHMGWDFRKEGPIEKRKSDLHEFFRPWVLWERSYALVPDSALLRFARGLWNHQIGNQETGNFSRHARYSRHKPGLNSEYPRHGGFYISTWAHAYEHSQDPVFLKAIRTLLSYFEERRDPRTGALPAESHERSGGRLMWPQSNLSLAVDLWASANRVPDSLAWAMRESALQTDARFLRLDHDLSSDEGEGTGFVKAADTRTLEPGDVRSEDRRARTRLWATGYGEKTDARIANFILLRCEQVRIEGYQTLVRGAAERYMDSEPNIDFPVYPGTLGNVINLLVEVHETTGEQRYLERAGFFAERARQMFFTGDSPLPKASSQHDHYEAITRADTLMMALLKLWAARHPGAAPELNLTYSDR